MKKRRTRHRYDQFAGTGEQLDVRYVLASIMPVQALEIEAFISEPISPKMVKAELRDRAVILADWAPVQDAVVVNVISFDAVLDTIDIALMDIATRGNVDSGTAQAIGGSIRGLDHVVTHSAEFVPSHTVDTLQRPPEGTIAEPPTSVESPIWDPGVGPELPRELPSLLVPEELPIRAPEVWEDLADVGPLEGMFTSLPGETRESAVSQPESLAEGTSELMSPTVSGLEMRHALEMPVESDEENGNADPLPSSDAPLGMDLVSIFRDVPEDAEGLSTSDTSSDVSWNPGGANEPSDETDVLLPADSQPLSPLNAGRIRPSVQWQDTDALANDSRGRTMLPDANTSAGDARPSARHSARTATVPGIHAKSLLGAGEFPYDADSADGGAVSWVDSYLSYLKYVRQWLDGVAASSSNRAGAEFVSAFLAAIAMTRLLENEDQDRSQSRRSLREPGVRESV